jgi:uncharacterized circularly permuted ATP-grasp superfamily protein
MGTLRYNEAFDDNGRLRAAYRAFEARTGRDGQGPHLPHTCAPAAVGGRYPIAPVPLVLADEEYAALAKAVRQRGLALQRLFLDLARGDFAVLRSIDAPEDAVEEILGPAWGPRDAWTRAWRDKGLEAVRFTYAPDLVRAPDGQWLVLEDNVGCVGGVVDADIVVERVCAYLNVSLHPSVPRGSSFERAVAAFLMRVGTTPTATTAAALLPRASADDGSEEHRKAEAILGLGLRVLPTTRAEAENVPPLAALVNFESDIGVGTPRLLERLFDRGCALMTAPGVGVLGHKAWLPFTDAIVSWYSGGAPLLRTASTAIFREMPADSSDWVLKQGNGCQGQAVVFLDHLSDAARRELERRARGWGQASGAVLQRRVKASVLPMGGDGDSTADAWQVELRPVVYVVGAATCLVAECPSARAFVNADGRGVGNMSRGAHYLAVIREPLGTGPA